MAAEEGVIGFPIRSPFKSGFSEERIMAKGITPEFTDQWTSLP
jgi:hypothetical protein